MNRIYKTIWNHASGTATAVSELTAACGKRSSGRSGSLKNAAPRFCLNALAAAMLIIGGQAFAATVSDGTGRNAIVIKGATVGVADPTKNTTAAGQDATAIGTNTTASAQSSFAAGTSAQATQNNALAIGTNAKANGVSASTFGHDATAQTAGDMAFGQGANAQGRSSVNGTAANTITNETYGPAMAQGAFANAQGRNAIAIGNNAKAQGTTASGTVNDVIAIGGNSTASGNRAVALGYKATAGATGQIAIGETTGNTNSQNAVFIGKNAGSGNTSTAGNTNGIAIGNGAGTGMKGGTENVAIGTNSGTAVNGNTNYAIGARAGQTVTGSDNYAMGIEAGRQVTGSQNSTFGYHSGTDITGSSNSAFGRDAGKNIVGSQNLAFGAYAGQYVGVTGTAVQDNIAIGTNANKFAAGSELTTSGNTAIGKDSKAQGGNSLALGTSAASDKANAVALGANSNTDVAATSVTQATVGGITYNGFAGSGIAAGDQVSVGNAGYNRQIKHVAAGEISKTSTDAINGSQLYAFASQMQAEQTHYYSVQSGQTGTGTNYANDGATGADSLAAGVKAVASGNNSVAVGSDVKALGDESLAVGNNVKISAGATGATAIGNNSKATAQGAQAFGQSSEAKGVNSAAIGRLSIAEAERSAAFGVGNTASGISSLSVGDRSIAKEAYSVAIGAQANAAGKNSIAAGYKANATNDGAVAIGANTAATNASTALGDGSKATGENSTALGWNANAAGRADVFIGKQAGADTANTSNFSNIGIGEGAVRNAGSATKDVNNIIGIGTGAAEGIQANHNIAMGAYANGTGAGAAAVNTANNVAIGERTRASGGNSIAVGNRTKAEGMAAIALGVAADAKGQNGFAAGQNTVASESGTIAIGGAPQAASAAQATGVQGVAIGQQSQASHTASLALGKGAKAKHNNAVALGADSETETAVGTTTATVNGITYSGFAGTAPTSTVSVGNGTIKRTVTNVAAGRINATSTDAINGSQLYLTQNVIGNMGGSLKTILGGNAALGTDGKLTMTNIGGTGKNTIHEAIQAANNNANAANAGFKIAANGDASGITADNKTIKSDETLTIKGTGTGAFSNYDSGNIQTQVSADGTVTVGLKKDLTVNSVTAGDSKLDTNGLTITGGPSVTKTGIDAGSKKITNVADGTIGAGSKDAINGGQLHTALSNINNNIAAAKTEVKSSDGSVSVTQGTNAAGATVYDLAVKTDGTTITKAADGSLKANTTTLAPATNGSIAAPSAADAGKLVNAGDIANAINQAGFNLTTSASTGAVSGSSVERVNAGKTVTIDAGKNIRISQNGGTVSIATQDNASFDSVTTGNAKLDNNGLTINGGPSVTQSGIDAAGNKITNVAAGTDPTDAVNVSQLNARLGATGQVAEEKLRQLEHKMDQNQDRANAGIAGAIAQGTIPQVTRPSAFGLGVGTGYYGGQSALAVGASAMTDGGNWIFKGNFSVNTKGRVGAGAGALYQW